MCCVCVYICMCVWVCECLRILCRSCTNDCAWQIMKIRLADPLPVSASFRISLDRVWKLCAIWLVSGSVSTARCSLPGSVHGLSCHAPRAAPRSSYILSHSCALRMFSIPARLDLRFPTGLNINSCRQTELLMGTSVRWPSWLSWPRSCLLYRWAHPFLMLPLSSSLASLPHCRLWRSLERRGIV